MSNFFTDVANEIKKEWKDFKDDFQGSDGNEAYYEDQQMNAGSFKDLNPDFIQVNDSIRQPVEAGDTCDVQPLPVQAEAVELSATEDDIQNTASETDYKVQPDVQVEVVTDMDTNIDAACGLNDPKTAEELRAARNAQHVHTPEDAADAGYQDDVAASVDNLKKNADETLNAYYVQGQTNYDDAKKNLHNQADAMHDTFQDQGTETVQAMSDVMNKAQSDMDAIRGQALRKLSAIHEEALNQADEQKRMADALNDNAQDAAVNGGQNNGEVIESVQIYIDDQKQNLLNAADDEAQKAAADADQIRKDAQAVYEDQNRRLEADKEDGLGRADMQQAKYSQIAKDVRGKAIAKEQATIDDLNRQINEAKARTQESFEYAAAMEEEGANKADACRDYLMDQYNKAIDAAEKRKDLAMAGADNREAQGAHKAETLRAESASINDQLDVKKAQIQNELNKNKDALLAESEQAKETLKNQADGLANQADQLYNAISSKL